MKPVSPVVRGYKDKELVFAKDQPEYLPLPALPLDFGNSIATRWRLTWRERLRVLFRGDVYLSVMTFRQRLQPVMLETEPPDLMRIFHTADEKAKRRRFTPEWWGEHKKRTVAALRRAGG